MGRLAVLLYGIISYAIFFSSFLYAVGFLGNAVVPKTINSGPETSTGLAILINVVLLSLFAVQHSGMARQPFKESLKTIIPEAAERSTYVLMSSLVFFLIFWQWRPITEVIWNVEHQAGVGIIYGLFALGWGIVLSGTFMINHFDLFGLRQVYYYFQKNEPTPIPFQAPMLYKYVRHPLMLGFTIAFWATPKMTTGHLLFAAGSTGYILVGIYFEEQSLKDQFGERYERYREQVPMLVPIPGNKYEEHEERTTPDHTQRDPG